MKFTQICMHPLKNCYMLHAKGTILPPFFGSKKDCEQMQIIWEQKLNSEFNKLSKQEQKQMLQGL